MVYATRSSGLPLVPMEEQVSKRKLKFRQPAGSAAVRRPVVVAEDGEDDDDENDADYEDSRSGSHNRDEDSLSEDSHQAVAPSQELREARSKAETLSQELEAARSEIKALEESIEYKGRILKVFVDKLNPDSPTSLTAQDQLDGIRGLLNFRSFIQHEPGNMVEAVRSTISNHKARELKLHRDYDRAEEGYIKLKSMVEARGATISELEDEKWALQRELWADKSSADARYLARLTDEKAKSFLREKAIKFGLVDGAKKILVTGKRQAGITLDEQLAEFLKADPELRAVRQTIRRGPVAAGDHDLVAQFERNELPSQRRVRESIEEDEARERRVPRAYLKDERKMLAASKKRSRTMVEEEDEELESGESDYYGRPASAQLLPPPPKKESRLPNSWLQPAPPAKRLKSA